MNRPSIDERMSLVLPGGWEMWNPQHGELIVAAAPEKGRDDVQPHFFVTRGPAEHRSSREFLVANVAALQQLAGYVEREVIEFEVQGYPVGCVSYDAPAGNWVLTNKQYFLVVGGGGYVFSCKMLPEQFAKWSPVFDQIVRSVEFKKD